MKRHYDRETDSLYIDLNARPSVESREIQDGVVIDLDIPNLCMTLAGPPPTAG